MNVLHLVGAAPYRTNCFLLISEEKRALVIDPGIPAKEIDKILEERGAKLALILLTHGHFDHVVGVEELAKEWDCPVYLDPADVKGDELYPVSMDTLPYHEDQPIELDDIKITPIYTPGHSQGSWLLRCRNFVFCGDTLFAGSAGRTDMEGGSRQQQRESLKRFKELPLDPETHLLPGHGAFTTLEEELEMNPYLMF